MQSEDPPPRQPDEPIPPSPSVVYPKLLPSSDYDLSSDPIHKHTQPDLPSVQPPGYKHEYQLACEVPAHLWPHNAEKLGMVRFLPRPQGVNTSKKLFVYQNEAADVISAYPGFLYTHPSLTCGRCRQLDLPCVQYMWDSPGPDNTWPNQFTTSITARTCLNCFMQTAVCDTIGSHILQPSRRRLIIDDALAVKLRTERCQDRIALTMNGPLKTVYGNKLKPTAPEPSSLGKRRRPDPEVSRDAPQDSGGMSNGSQILQGIAMQPLTTDTNTQIPAQAISVSTPDPFSMSLRRAQRSIERTIKKALEARETELQDAEKAIKEATSAKQRESDAESRRTVMEGRLQEVTSELEAAKESLLGAKDRAVTAYRKLAESNQKLVDSDLALAAARSEIRDGMKAVLDLSKENDRLKTDLQQAKSAVAQIEDAHKLACRRVAGLEADLEHSKHVAHEQDMRSQAERDQCETEKEELSRRLRAAERRVTELEWQGRKRSSGPVIVIDDDDDESRAPAYYPV